MIRRLTIEDADLLREAWGWDEGRPRWYRDMDGVFNIGDLDDLIKQVRDKRQAFIGIWDDGEFVAVIIVVWCGDGRFTAHLMARRGADPAAIIAVGQQLTYDMLGYGLNEACVWIAEKNRSVRKLCSMMGFQPDGVVMWRGAYHSRPIKWVRHSIQREQLVAVKAA